MDYELQKLDDKVIRKGDFLFPRGYSEIIVRMPNTRKINHISIEEIAHAMYQILSQCIGINRDGLCAETAKLYFGRSGKNITIAMNDACDLLISEGRAKEVGGKGLVENKVSIMEVKCKSKTIKFSFFSEIRIYSHA